MAEINICCRFFEVLPCAEFSDEHCHIGCMAISGASESIVIDNKHAAEHCLSETFKECPYYPKRG